MPFCPKCGFKLGENDTFCYQCGNKIEIGNTNAPENTVSSIPQPSNGYTEDNNCYLSVCCLASSSFASTRIVLNKKGVENPLIKVGETKKIAFEPGDHIITFVVDRGPGLTFVASRVTTYRRRLSFHPGETITMDVNAGRQMTQVNFTSSLGYQIK